MDVQAHTSLSFDSSAAFPLSFQSCFPAKGCRHLSARIKISQIGEVSGWMRGCIEKKGWVTRLEVVWELYG